MEEEVGLRVHQGGRGDDEMSYYTSTDLMLRAKSQVHFIWRDVIVRQTDSSVANTTTIWQLRPKDAAREAIYIFMDYSNLFISRSVYRSKL